jgi:Family of unknown function (DUF5677)
MKRFYWLVAGALISLMLFKIYKNRRSKHMSSEPIFGVPSEWQRFVKEYHVVAQKLGPLHETITKVFIRQWISQTNADSTIFFLGRLCAEDFSEILLMCGNGYGFGAMRLLRSMYERAVTMAYLVKNPSEVDDFLDYFLVTQRKVLNRLINLQGEAEVEKMLGRKMMEEVENDFQKVKSRFINGKKLQMSWTNKKMEDLVKVAGKEYMEMYLECYTLPLLQAHPSASSILNRLEDNSGTISFDLESNSRTKILPLIMAHNLVVRDIDLQNKYFKLGLDAEIEERAKDFLECWKK